MAKDLKKLEEELDSDNELPSSYADTPETPAYKNDNRFDPIKFPWINKFNYDKLPVAQNPMPITHTSLNDGFQKKRQKSLIKRGVLNQQDLFCLKAIETVNGNSTMLWLINFFIHKDMQADYKFLKTCLVNNIFEKSYDNTLFDANNSRNTCKLEILVL